MSQFRKGHHGAALVLIAGATATLIGSQIAFTTLFSGLSDVSAETLNVVDERDYQAPIEPVSSARRSTSQMNAAVASGQFEDLVKPTPVPTVAPTPIPAPVATATPTAAPKPTAYETGIASTYGEGDGFEGNLTACGEVFHTNVVQVAHKSLPCGTLIRIEDSDTGRSVIAHVTDRGPYITGRIVDLSWGAFEQLDPTGPGLLNVSVYVLDQ